MSPSNDNERRVAWITGASRGIGADTALRLAARGYDVALTARDQSRLDALAAEIDALGTRALAFSADLTDRAAMGAFADAALEWGGRCDVLCNIGVYQGADVWQSFVETPIDEIARSLEGDVVAPALLCQRAIPSMVANGGGVIVNMSSAVVFLTPGDVEGSGWSLAYAASKAGIDQFAKSINAELGAAGVRAYTVEPGHTAYGDQFRALVGGASGAPVNPAEAIGAAIVWLVESPEAERLLAKRIHLPAIAQKQSLLEGWDGPGSAYPTRW